jgi:phosphoglucosamine mutase
VQAARQLFGTDGIRGIAGEYPLNPATVFAIGRALGARLKRNNPSARVVFGQDTRESSAWISETLARGLMESGVALASSGVLTTPGVAYLTRTHGFSAGIVVSASHNPWQDNGIKLFGPDGMKLADAIEHEIEAEIFSHLAELAGAHGKPTEDSRDVLPGEDKLRDDYIGWLLTNIEPQAVRGMRVLIDCANGAATSVAPELFRRSGIEAEYLQVDPDGRNINHECGALHPEKVAREVAASDGRYLLGITFDGDADRALFSDARGRVVNGDGVMLIASRDMKRRGRLNNDTVVATTMSNMGLEKALQREGVQMLRANVGDKYVLEQMLKTGATLGGEQSGHILFMDGDSTTGDGLLTALRVLDVVARSGKSLEELVAGLKEFPQVIRNVKVREKVPLERLTGVVRAIRSAEAELNGNGRVLVRYSGTEKLARVMIEAESESLTYKHVAAIVEALQQEIGV